MQEPWWKTWPGRLRAELRALRRACMRYELDIGAWAGGTLCLQVWPEVGGETIHLVVTFPALYPFFRFDVVAPELELPHHQHAQSKSLCLWGRATDNWDTDQLLATALQDRLPMVLRAGRATAATADLAEAEEQQAEPFSDYYPYAPESVVLVDGSWRIDPALQSGRLRFGVAREFDGRFRGLVIDVQDEAERTLLEADARLRPLFPERLRGRWVRVPAPIRVMEPRQFFEALAQQHPTLQQPLDARMGALTVDVVGVLFPEERAWRAAGEGWVFLVRSANTSGRRRPGQAHEVLYRFARALRCGPDDLAARTPELGPLRSACIAIAGVGGLGAPSALEFARAGVGRLHLLDHDFVDPGMAVRWPLGLPVAAAPKTAVLAEMISQQWPYTAVTTCTDRIGVESSRAGLERLEAWAADADLIYDATAELGVNYYLSELARKRNIPYVCVWTLQGVWGGIVLRVHPTFTRGCWLCVRHHMFAGTIPAPPHDPGRPVQPLGCADPTFVGSGFDLTALAAAGVRSAVAALTGSTAGAYPAESWDVLVLAFRDPAGRLIPPSAQTFALTPHPACPHCRA